MFAREAPCAKALEEATLRVEWALDPKGHSSPWDWYTKAMASTIQWAHLPFLLTSVADKELLRASKALGAVHVNVQRSYGTQQCQGWVKIFVMTQQAEPSIWVKKNNPAFFRVWTHSNFYIPNPCSFTKKNASWSLSVKLSSNFTWFIKDKLHISLGFELIPLQAKQHFSFAHHQSI